MTNEEIIKKVIKKANRKDAKLFGNLLFKEEDFRLTLQYHHIEIVLNDNTKIVGDLYGVIFSHSLAKAFWGKDYVCQECGDSIKKCRIDLKNTCGYEGEGNKQIAWQYYLQQLVLEEEPLKYLEKFL